VNGVAGVLRGSPDLRPGTVSTLTGPATMPAFCTVIMTLFIGLSQAGGFGSDIALLTR
jgi:hypothetical protein